MKTLILMLLLPIGLMAQEKNTCLDILASEYSQSVSGVILKDGFTDSKSYYSIVEIPSYYDFELVRSSVNRTIKRFSDVEVVKGWHRSEGGYFEIIVATHGYLISITYTKGDTMIILMTDNIYKKVFDIKK